MCFLHYTLYCSFEFCCVFGLLIFLSWQVRILNFHLQKFFSFWGRISSSRSPTGASPLDSTVPRPHSRRLRGSQEARAPPPVFWPWGSCSIWYIKTLILTVEQCPKGLLEGLVNKPFPNNLWSPYGIGRPYIFSSCFFLLLLLLLFFSSPNLSSRRLDVYHTSAHGVVLV